MPSTIPPLPADIRTYHAEQTAAHAKICVALSKAIDDVLMKEDGAERKVWHRHPVWFIDGNPIVGYSMLKGTKGKTGPDGPCIRLLFWSGQSFDEAGLLPAPPETTFQSADARFVSVDEIDAKALKRWLKKSVEIQWDYKNIVKRKGKLVRLK